MALAEFHRPLVTEDGKPLVREIDGISNCDLIPIPFGRKRGREALADGVIELADFVNIYYTSWGKKPPKDERAVFLQKVSSVTSDKDLSQEEKRQRVIPMFEFVPA